MASVALLALVYAYRVTHPQASAEAARHLKIWIATANTALLLTSSLAVAFAVLAARHGKRRVVGAALLTALVLGLAFLGLKAWEYLQDFQEGLAPGAAAKAGLIAWVYMHLREQPGLNRVAALLAVAWLSILVAMTLIELGTRR